MKHSLKYLLFLITISLTVFGGGCLEDSTIKIGNIFPFTGNDAEAAQRIMNGIKLATEKYNDKGGILNKKIELIAYDDQNNTNKTVEMAEKLIEKDQVDALIAGFSSKITLTFGPVAVEHNVPLISPTASNINVTKMGSNVFRCIFIDPFQGKILARFAKNDLKVTKASILFNKSDDYSVGLSNVFKNAFKEMGGNIVGSYSYKVDDSDFKVFLEEIKNNKSEILFIPEYTVGTIAKILQQAKELDLKIIYLGGDGWDSLSGSTARQYISEAYFTSSFSLDDTSPLVREFVIRYKNKHQEEPTAYAALAYDSASLMYEAIKIARTTNKNKVIKALREINWEGVTGNIRFDEERNPIKSVVIIKIENGQNKYFSKVDPE